MSQKKHTYTDLSDTHKCRICKKAIKERLIEIKTVKPTLCYKHYKMIKGEISRQTYIDNYDKLYKKTVKDIIIKNVLNERKLK